MPRVLIVQNKTFHPLIAAARVAHIEVESIPTATPADLLDRPGLGACILCLPNPQSIALCRQLKAETSLAGLPIVLFLDPADPETVAAGLDAGMDSFLGATTSSDRLAQRLSKIVQGQKPLPGLGQNHRGGVITALLDEWAETQQDQQDENSRRRLAEHVLSQQQQLVLTLINHLPERIFVKDAQGHYVLDNLSHLRFLGKRSPDEVLGKTVFDLFPPDQARRFATHDRVVLESGRPLIEQVERIDHPNGEVRWISTSKVPLPDPETGKTVGLIGVTRDITDQKRIQDQLIQARDAAEAANHAKSQFLCNVSHEIRTPMNGIMGMTELLLDTALSEQQRDYLTLVMSSAEEMMRVVDDILDFSKIDAGMLDLCPIPFEVRDSLGDTVRTLALRAHRKGIELACHVHPEVPACVVGDPHRLRQVIVNLVGNGIKFTDHGEVVVECAVEKTGEVPRLHFSVRDTGIGIPADMLQQIFEPFRQVESGLNRRYSGTGLGLTISTRLVEMMGGRMWVESKLGKGSIFHFVVNMPASSEPSRAGLIPRLQGLRVLIVDDNATNRRILHDMLASVGMVPLAVSGADEALEWLSDLEERNETVPLILLDAMMPEVDGFMLAQSIRDRHFHAGATIMMLSSSDRTHEVDRCRQLGIAAYLLKPIKQSELISAMLAELASAQPARVAPTTVAAATAPSVPRQRLHILLAEDNRVNQMLAAGVLHNEGYSVVVASNGHEALAQLDKEKFDLILMDVQMPEMDGFEATAIIRERERKTGLHLPIIALTAHAMKGDRERCLDAGMDAYVAKPIKARVLLETIRATCQGVCPTL